MEFFRKLVLKILGVKEEKPMSLHELVANEIIILIRHVMVKHGFSTMDEIYQSANFDTMTWFRIRNNNYGESGSHYGVAEIISHQDSINLTSPSWLKLIPTDQLDNIWLELYGLLREREPIGGHGLHDENRLKAANEFATQLLSKIFEAEKDSRRA